MPEIVLGFTLGSHQMKVISVTAITFMDVYAPVQLWQQVSLALIKML